MSASNTTLPRRHEQALLGILVLIALGWMLLASVLDVKIDYRDENLCLMSQTGTCLLQEDGVSRILTGNKMRQYGIVVGDTWVPFPVWVQVPNASL